MFLFFVVMFSCGAKGDLLYIGFFLCGISRNGKKTAPTDMFLHTWDFSVRSKGDRSYTHISSCGRKFSSGWTTPIHMFLLMWDLFIRGKETAL